MSEAALAKYESSRTYPNLQVAASLADYFGVSIDYLACGEKASVISVDGLTDEQVDLVTEKVLDLDMLRYYPAIRNDKRALEMIAALASHLPDIGVIGEIPYELSLQMMLYELDPEKEIFSEDERALIEEYALQFRDMNRSRELAEHICYQEEYGNQDVAPVVIEARREIQQKKEEHLQQRKR